MVPQKDLTLMDNNVLRSPRFDDISDDIMIEEFASGQYDCQAETGRIHRYQLPARSRRNVFCFLGKRKSTQRPFKATYRLSL